MSEKLSKNDLDKWLITAMSHMKTMYEDNDIPWSDEEEATFQQVRHQCLEAQAEPSEEWIEEKAERFMLKCPGIVGWYYEGVKKFVKDFIRNLFKEAKEEKNARKR
ncbi:hypothetical protein KA005_28670 [bacterium]|nr:hypothetical protein [bacterium]